MANYKHSTLHAARMKSTRAWHGYKTGGEVSEGDPERMNTPDVNTPDDQGDQPDYSNYTPSRTGKYGSTVVYPDPDKWQGFDTDMNKLKSYIDSSKSGPDGSDYDLEAGWSVFRNLYHDRYDATYLSHLRDEARKRWFPGIKD